MNKPNDWTTAPGRAAGVSEVVVRFFSSIRSAVLRRPGFQVCCRSGEARPIESAEPSSSRQALGCERKCRSCSLACSVGRRYVRTRGARWALHGPARCRCNPPRTVARTCSPQHLPMPRPAVASRRGLVLGGGVSWRRSQSLPPERVAATNANSIGVTRGETDGARCRVVGEESVQFGVRFHPPSLEGSTPALRSLFHARDRF